MPTINIDTIADLTDDERKLVEKIPRPDGRLRASKPTVPRKVEVKTGPGRFDTAYRHVTPEAIFAGKTAYVWRMVALQISPHHRHQCMPVMADSDINGAWDEKQVEIETLDDLVKRIVDSVRPDEWHGVKRWGQAMGQIGTPVVRQGGTIVYR
jgi:hypothetical protein